MVTVDVTVAENVRPTRFTNTPEVATVTDKTLPGMNTCVTVASGFTLEKIGGREIEEPVTRVRAFAAAIDAVPVTDAVSTFAALAGTARIEGTEIIAVVVLIFPTDFRTKAAGGVTAV
jgi:hypothetical protein